MIAIFCRIRWRFILCIFILLISVVQNVVSFSCPLPSPVLKLNISQFAAGEVVSRKGGDFLDVKVGTNLTLTCEGTVKSNCSSSSSVGNSVIEWILPEFHPVKR